MTTEPTEPREQTAQPQEPEVPAGRELKVVIVLWAGRGLVGVSSPNCDPHMVSLQLAEADSLWPGFGLAQVLAEVPGIVALARERWQKQRQYPRYERPALATPPANTRARPAPKPGASAPSRAATPKPGPTIETPRLI